MIDEVQTTSNGVLDPNLVYIAQSAQWIGAANCPTQWAYFDAKDNPHFAAAVLSAKLADRVLRVYVDDTLPKVGGFCQVSYLSML